MIEMASEDAPCPRCGAEIPPPARFCPACGYAAARLTPGQTLDGKYEILEKIGEGGMGQVYKARHVHLDEIRIIKVTKPDALGEGPDPRRFQEEARMATLVRHPNVAALYDFSRLPDGSYYMVWEFIDGVTLEEWMRRHRPLPLSQALDVSRQVLAGLAEIHAQGIVHRDLSPDNILVRENREGRIVAKIIDLGIAKRMAAESLAMTGTGLFLGKLKYCSPEQAGALAEGKALDGRSDLYAFGVVLYEMLAGRPPFESQTPEGYLGKHLHSAPPPLDTERLPRGRAPPSPPSSCAPWRRTASGASLPPESSPPLSSASAPCRTSPPGVSRPARLGAEETGLFSGSPQSSSSRWAWPPSTF